MYDEINRQVKKLPPDGLKKFTHSNAVTEDEVYYFPRLISPVKVSYIRYDHENEYLVIFFFLALSLVITFKMGQYS